MPFRSVVSPASARFQRFFHSSIIRRVNNNHYETLHLRPDATPLEIKKSFYALSKAHHPDHHPNDPSASSRFVEISEAYAVLGKPSSRQKYDLEVMHVRHGASSHPQGSYHSSNPAGGRPASGLSRRRTHFQGPPPSFYRSGGWGSQASKRQAAQGNGAETAGGMGPGQHPFGNGGDVPHFDREGHLRTHTNHEKRRQRRMEKGYVPSEPTRGVLADFVVISIVVSLVASLGLMLPPMFDGATTRSKSENR